MPGDQVIRRPDVVCTHATTINAPPQQVWPWLQQVGWHRGGWYTARWVDRLLFPDHWASADELLPDYQHLAVGDFIPDGSPETGCGFTVVEPEPARFLLLHSTTHLPRSWRDRRIAALHWTWVFVLTRWRRGRRTRFVFRWRGRIDPWWLRVLCHAVIVPADFIMSRDMLRGLRQRAERTATSTPLSSFSVRATVTVLVARPGCDSPGFTIRAQSRSGFGEPAQAKG